MTTMTDLKRALDAHIECLARCGITYDGRLDLDEGSKLYGRAFRLYLTDKLDRCQERRYVVSPAETWDADIPRVSYRWPDDMPEQFRYQAVVWHGWNHADCDRCAGTKLERCSGHYNPPVGDDFLGMTKAEAYETLTARTRAIYDTAGALS